MLIKPILPILKNKKDYTGMSYIGTVEDNNDPEKLGRVRVRISIYGDLAPEDLPWASPLLGSHGNSSSAGGFNIPSIGNQVRVTFPSKDMTAPYYSGAELNSLNKVTLFDDNYPNAYGYKDENGNFIKIDKKVGTTHLQHESSTNMHVTSDGSIVVAIRGGLKLTLSSYRTFELVWGGGKIQGLTDGSISVNSESEIDISAMKTVINSPVEINNSLSVKNGANGVLVGINGAITFTDGIITGFEGFM